MAGNLDQKITVKAIYKFKASNNDELTFKKGELITVTQIEDGGWWEGTSHESAKTGWFPSNYVKEVVESSPAAAAAAPNSAAQDQLSSSAAVADAAVIASAQPAAAAATAAMMEDLQSNQAVYRQQLISELVDKEMDFIQELRTLCSEYLHPLNQTADMLSESEYRQLVGNLEDVAEVHNTLHVALKEEIGGGGGGGGNSNNSNPLPRIGRVLLNNGALIKAAHLTYWANHPKAVCVFEKYRDALDAFMEGQGASKPGLMILTTGLSRPFRHLERYAGLMQEVEQHLPDNHVDRGDTQRSIGFYKNVASECAKLRRQKELELEVLSGSIRGWEGEAEVSSMGDILHMGSVAVGPEHKDRYLVLFPDYLLLLSVSARMSAFIYQGKLPLSGIAVNRLQDTDTVKNSFEITGPMIDRILCVCQSKADSLKWVEHLKDQTKVSRSRSIVQSQQPPPPPPTHKPPPPSSPSSGGNQKRYNAFNSGGQQQQPPFNNKGYVWKMSCLRPAPPTRSFLQSHDNNAGTGGSGSNRGSVAKKKDGGGPDTTYEEDMQILRVIEAYCAASSAKQRQTIAASTIIESSITSPHNQQQHFEDSIVVVGGGGGSGDGGRHLDDHSLSEDSRSATATESLMKSFKEQLSSLKYQNRVLRDRVEEEVNARKRLETILKNNLLPNRSDIQWNDDL